ncbi:TIGR03016 family PEP-CTERM system-associated outer membrane protein [Oleidesulfovibrio sp.]|uniref:TIGR03016 family PEP-CTERM system-associated outer membrane protein n=1 Tax=Oleidesulfovibrio sp. TaxID=2909707 RepID=UPI003A8761CB
MKRLLFLLLAVAFCLSPSAAAADLDLNAGVSVGGEYNDNVDETSGGRSDYITHVKPTLGATYEGGRITGSLSYAGDYQYYKDGTYEDDYNHRLEAEVLANVIEDFFFVSVTDNYSSVYSDARRGEVLEGDDTEASGTVDRNVATFSPYFVLHPDERTQINTGYKFTDLRYMQQDDGTDKMSHQLFVDVDRLLSEKLSALAGYSVTQEDAEEEEGPSDDLIRHRVYVGGTYTYAEESSITLRVGPSYTEYDRGGSATDLFYEASLVHSFGSVIATLGFNQDYTDDPDTGDILLTASYNAGLTKVFDRASLTLAVEYSESEEAEGSVGAEGSASTTKRWRPSLRGTYELSERAVLTSGLVYDTEDTDDGETERWYYDAALSYEMLENIKATLSYRYKSVDEPGSNPWNSNRIMAEVGVTF